MCQGAAAGVCRATAFAAGGLREDAGSRLAAVSGSAALGGARPDLTGNRWWYSPQSGWVRVRFALLLPAHHRYLLALRKRV